MRVKICGMTNLEDAKFAVAQGVDALGFVFCNSLRKINIENASYILKSLPPFVNTVAVFCNHSISFINEVLKNCPFDTLQFHGEEDYHVLMHFKPQKKIIKTIKVKDEQSLAVCKDYAQADYFLLDTYSENNLGGTGKTFNWDLIQQVKEYKKPIILSGGLNPDNVKVAISKTSPDAVDVSSGVEKDPGKKSKQLVKQFIINAKKQ
jgi:phosphoribosylanthranilate isomerase